MTHLKLRLLANEIIELDLTKYGISEGATVLTIIYTPQGGNCFPQERHSNRPLRRYTVPLWLLSGLAVAAGLLLRIPGLMPAAVRPWVIGGGVTFGVLAIARAVAMAFEKMPAWEKARAGRRRFHVTAEPQQSFWSSAKQADGSIVTQVVARLVVKNRTDEPLGLAHVRL